MAYSYGTELFIDLTNWHQFFLCVCPLTGDELRHNIVKVVVEPRAAGEETLTMQGVVPKKTLTML